MKKNAFIYWGSCVLLAFFATVYWFVFWKDKVYTDDAYVEGNMVYITPLRPGFVQAIHTDNTFLVKKGQILVELDRTDAEIALNKAKENLAQVVREVCQLFHQVFAYQAEIEVKKAEWTKAIQDYQHRESVLSAGGVSVENFEHSIATLRVNYYALRLSEILFEKALSLVQKTTLRNHPLVLAAADRVREAWVQLYRCTIYSPVEGIAAQRTIQVGMWIDAGKPLLSVIPLDQIWVNANFKETQLKQMKIGQHVKIRSDLYGDEVYYQGKIVGLPAAAGNAFSLLPPQNLSGNWIKIVQRLPVRIALDPQQLRRYPLRLGLSLEATVDLADQMGELVPSTTAGSPTYDTPIFEIEERGDQELIESIITANLDDTLLPFHQKELELPCIQTPLPPLFKNFYDYDTTYHHLPPSSLLYPPKEEEKAP